MTQTNGFFTTSDQAHLYYEVHGKGQPLFLVHGWQCSSRFWQHNIPELSKHFQVIVMDNRGHGKSSKGLQGQIVARYAQDIRELSEFLGLKNFILMGWSLGGPTVLSYWQQYKTDSNLIGLGLIDMTPFPFSPEEWNSQGLRNYNMEGFNAQVNRLVNEREEYFEFFANAIFKDGKRPAGTDWVIEEFRKLPPWLSAAIYSDYIATDFTNVLPTITVPTLVVNADGPVFAWGIKQGTYLTSLIPNGKFVAFTESGHMLFYEEAEKFNQTVSDFIKDCLLQQCCASRFDLRIRNFKITSIPGISNVTRQLGKIQQTMHLFLRVTAYDPQNITDIGTIHTQNKIIFFIIFFGKLHSIFDPAPVFYVFPDAQDYLFLPCLYLPMQSQTCPQALLF